MNGLFARAIVAFVACPGVVAFIVPLWLLRRVHGPVQPSGVALVTLGSIILLWCVRDFYAAGKGTLAPWSPPQHLVSSGLYRVSRNPMYLGVVAILVGWALAFRSQVHAAYAAAVAVAFYVRVVWFEEPWLQRRHGAAWDVYRQRVPRRFLW